MMRSIAFNVSLIHSIEERYGCSMTNQDKRNIIRINYAQLAQKAKELQFVLMLDDALSKFKPKVKVSHICKFNIVKG